MIIEIPAKDIIFSRTRTFRLRIKNMRKTYKSRQEVRYDCKMRIPHNTIEFHYAIVIAGRHGSITEILHDRENDMILNAETYIFRPDTITIALNPEATG